MDRRKTFDKVFEDYDEKAITKCVDFTWHRFVSIERDSLTTNRYAKGHKSMRGACSYLARAIEEGEPYVPERILDLDSGELHELDMFAFVAPKSVDAVAVMMPRGLMEETVKSLDANDRDANAIKVKLMRAALARRS